MAVPENPKVEICYIWVISLLLFIFTVSGAIFLVLYMIQPSPTTAWYLIIGVSLVCFPWFFWFLTMLYRIVSRACGFRMVCFGPFGADHPDADVPSGGPAISIGGGSEGVVSIPIHNPNTATTNGVGGNGNGGDDNLVNESGNGNEGRSSGVGVQPGSPKRVHFGGVVVIGEEDGGGHGDQENPKPLSSPSSSSSSSSPSPSRNSDESEMPLRLFMAS